MKRLPLSLDDLRGLRAARWVRESTPGQFDRYGPEAQVELQDGAIGRLGLVDAGLCWRAAHSGRTVYRSAEMEAMLGAAERDEFDVLLVGYVSRWQRNLRRTLELLEDKLHPVGVPIYFVDEDILSSAERDWDQLIGEAQDAERYSRRLSRRIREGYASKRTKERDPGGQPPFGFRRNGAKLLEPDPATSAAVVTMYELSAAGLTDATVAGRTGIGLYTVRGVLTSPLYVGRLRDGTRAHWDPLVPDAVWETVRIARSQRATNAGRKADPRRPYALDMLHCASCGRRLTGDTGYYRHREPCNSFVAARPAERHGRGRWNGHAYRKELYEEVVEGLLAEMALGASTLTRVVSALAGSGAGPDRRELDRIKRERTRATTRYVRDRDTTKLDATMRELDRAAEAARTPKTGAVIPADVAVRYLRDLPGTWRAAEGGPGQQLLASALFSRIEVLGLQEATVHLTEHAVRHGVASALPAEVGISVSGRGERI
ncbi:MAG: recombinase family protein [Candidatus Limnocylindrales bacterium]